MRDTSIVMDYFSNPSPRDTLFDCFHFHYSERGNEFEIKIRFGKLMEKFFFRGHQRLIMCRRRENGDHPHP